MKRFKNILVVYDLVPGSDETLQKAVDLATRNRAQLTVVHTVNPITNERDTIAERERLLKRLVDGLFLPETQKAHVVRHGPPAESILKLARQIGADLIVTPEQNKGFYAQFLGLDTSAQLLRRAECPVWTLRPQKTETYRRIVAAVNAGKPGALDCLANRRILEIGSSLAILERAELHLVYAWDFEGKERDTVTSELPRGKYEELSARAQLENHQHIVNLVEHVLGDFVDYTAVPVRGTPRTVIVDYVKEQSADLLIIDGRIDGAIKSALIDNTATHLLQQSACSVLCTRPAPALASAGIRDAA